MKVDRTPTYLSYSDFHFLLHYVSTIQSTNVTDTRTDGRYARSIWVSCGFRAIHTKTCFSCTRSTVMAESIPTKLCTSTPLGPTDKTTSKSVHGLRVVGVRNLGSPIGFYSSTYRVGQKTAHYTFVHISLLNIDRFS